MREEWVFEKLRRFEKKGFLFHGSKNPNIEILRPHKAECDTRSDSNTETAVYLSPFVSVGIAFACVKGFVEVSNISGSWEIGWNDEWGILMRLPKAWREFVYELQGFVYVCSGEFLEEKSFKDWQVKIKRDVIPLQKLEVTFPLYEKFGGEIEWT